MGLRQPAYPVVMTADTQTVLHSVLEAWERSGAVGVRDAVWAMAPGDQMRLAIDLYNQRELEPLLACIPDELVHDMRPTGIPGMGLYHGPAGYRRFLQEWLGAFPDSSLVAQSFEGTEDRVFAVIRQEMRGAGSGVPMTFTYAALMGFREGRPVESEFHTDLPSARERFAALAAAAGS